MGLPSLPYISCFDNLLASPIFPCRLSLYALLLAGVAAVGYYVYSSYLGGGQRKPTAQKQVAPTSAAAVAPKQAPQSGFDEDWIVSVCCRDAVAKVL